MSKIVFFSIPAYGHTNPTIEVVRELVNKGNEVIYYSFKEFKEKIEDTGAKCICCDEYLPELKAEYEAEDITLTPDFPLGVSNRFQSMPVTVAVRDGALLVMQEKS